MAIEGFKSSAVFDEIKTSISDEKLKAETIKKVNSIFQFNIKNSEGKEQIWTLDLKKEGSIKEGKHPKPDITMTMDDESFVQIASGKLNGKISNFLLNITDAFFTV
ncbi:9216_t:CDS:2 [Cetraspora pellucida]|uniref:9216_t:CDS:1 n=1 Tax=Cetraspora pellucida TaxID=1433469 RepID=A0A9N9BXY7_9GLOM|nr:9216_t:CDS:2 [Cetraspora pellucida]